MNSHNSGSAYLFVLGIIVIAMLILMASMRRSVDSNKQTFSIEQHIVAQNRLDSCEAFVFHVVKTWPFDQRPELEFADSQIEIDSYECAWKRLDDSSRRFDFEIRTQHLEILKLKKVRIEGAEFQTGIQWRKFNLD